MKLTKQQALEIIWDDADGWERVTQDKMVGQSRWSTEYEAVFKHVDSGKTYMLCWDAGSTESQCQGPWEYEDSTEAIEVEAFEKTITEYREVKHPKENQDEH